MQSGRDGVAFRGKTQDILFEPMLLVVEIAFVSDPELWRGGHTASPGLCTKQSLFGHFPEEFTNNSLLQFHLTKINLERRLAVCHHLGGIHFTPLRRGAGAD